MNFDQARFNMVEQQIRPWNVFDSAVLYLFMTVKREDFVVDKYKEIALSDLEIPLPSGQKMLSPCEEARLIQELNVVNTDKVLEIGTGSGYVTALLAKLADFVYSIEIDEENKKFANKNLAVESCYNATLYLGNGLSGLQSMAPFDKIFVGGGVIEIPLALKEQLKIGGKLVGFVGASPVMHAVVVVRNSIDGYIETKLFETDVEYLIKGQSQQFIF
jgi:protein-L-isoaspartate(D-aspartate) O-methyltransferase